MEEVIYDVEQSNEFIVNPEQILDLSQYTLADADVVGGLF